MNNGALPRKISLICKRLTRILHKASLINCNKRIVSLSKMLKSITRSEMISSNRKKSSNEAKSVKYRQTTRLVDRILRRIKSAQREIGVKLDEEAESLLEDIEGMVNAHLIEEEKETQLDVEDVLFSVDLSFGFDQGVGELKGFTSNYFEKPSIDGNHLENFQSFLFPTCLLETPVSNL